LLEPDKRIWVDVGAGAGFPGLVLAIALKRRPGVSIHLVESLAKRCRFLDAVSVALDLPVVIHNRRAEQAVIENVEVVTARACAPMIKLLGFTEALMRGGAFGLFLKGKDAQREIGEALATWRFNSTVIPSRSGGAEGYVVKVEGLRRA
jgi:16S rRNA (guanine527-N7)-methyltransferase